MQVCCSIFFFFNDTATTEIYTLSLHDALPICEKIAEIYWGPAFGGAIEGWFAYMLALAFLMFRPQGLFGEKIIERV